MSKSPTNRPPDQLDGALVVCFASLDGLLASGGTSHRIADDIKTDFSAVCIARYPGDESCYLFYCDADWSVVTDTFHLKLNEAKHQAEFEYPGVSDRWIELQASI